MPPTERQLRRSRKVIDNIIERYEKATYFNDSTRIWCESGILGEEIKLIFRFGCDIKFESYTYDADAAFRILKTRRAENHLFLVNYSFPGTLNISEHTIALLYIAEKNVVYLLDPECRSMKDVFPLKFGLELVLKDRMKDEFPNIGFEHSDYILGGYRSDVVDERIDYLEPSMRPLFTKTEAPQRRQGMYVSKVLNDTDVPHVGNCILWSFIMARYILEQKPLPATDKECFQVGVEYIWKASELFSQ